MTEDVEPPQLVKLFPIRGCILPPGQHLPLNVFEPRYLNMVDDAMASDRYLGMVQPAIGGTPEKPALQRVGTAGRIVSHRETDDGRYLIVLEGVMRFCIDKEPDEQSPYRLAQADYRAFHADPLHVHDEPALDRDAYLQDLKRFFDLVGVETEWEAVLQAPLGLIINKTAMAVPFEPAQKQALLEAADITERADQLQGFIHDSLMRLSDPPRPLDGGQSEA